MNIIGKSECTPEQMTKYLIDKNPDIDPSIVLEIARYYIEEGEAEGVRGDGAWIQLCKETHNLKFDNGTAVTFDQNNFCGLGVTRKGMKGHSFATRRLGARANIQHLHAYATTVPLKNPCIDPRYKYVNRGCAPTFELLTGKWSNPGYDTNKASSLQDALNKKIGYGFDIIKGIETIKKIKVNPDDLKSNDTIASPGKYYRIQVGCYRDHIRALAKRDEVLSKGFNCIIKEEDGLYYVQLGAYSKKSNADSMLVKVRAAGYPTAFIKYF